MGDPRHAKVFTRKLRIDLDKWPMHVVGTVKPPPVYSDLGLRHKGSLVNVYSETVTLETFASAARSLASGLLPTYDAGGDLTQLGGTIAFRNISEDSTDAEPLIYHAEETTGGHIPSDILAEKILAM
mmetsp:Transcript_80332/g.157055  ORF Transcript_80332/g.157055 Transcript_80332/m.157055 type:complete len:127 (-) Transcript_80332:204-584(-)